MHMARMLVKQALMKIISLSVFFLASAAFPVRAVTWHDPESSGLTMGVPGVDQIMMTIFEELDK